MIRKLSGSRLILLVKGQPPQGSKAKPTDARSKEAESKVPAMKQALIGFCFCSCRRSHR